MSDVLPTIPHFPYGDPHNRWQIDGDDFYKEVDKVFAAWWKEESASCDLSNHMPYELTERLPEPRPVQWNDRASSCHREWKLPVHPAVAEHTEYLEQIERPSLEEVTKVQFSPSPLACFRRGFAEGSSREKARNNANWQGTLEKEALRRAVIRNGADYARDLVETVTKEVEAERAAGLLDEPVKAEGGAFNG